MRLLLVRHGESVHATEGLVSGHATCRGLTPTGREQTERLRDRLVEEETAVDVVLSSTVLRARQTAEILKAAFPAVSPAQSDCDLCEMHVGDGDGMTAERFAERYGAFDPVEEPHRPLSPGGDDWTSFGSRVARTMDALAEVNAGRTVLAVSHAGFIVRAFLELFAVPRPGTGARIEPAFASVTEWHHPPGGVWELVGLDRPPGG